MNTYIYFHICCKNNWREIVSKLLSDIKESGLYDKVTKIRCMILAVTVDVTLFNDPKIEIIGNSPDYSLYEQATINKLYEESLKEDFKVLYIHSKGIRHNGKIPSVTDWVKYLTYFNIYKHEHCMELLDTYDTVGVNLIGSPVLHYSGNFWWSKSEHIRKLGICPYINYNSPEFWVTSIKARHKGIWRSFVNHYRTRYEEHNYIKPNTESLVNPTQTL